MCNSSTKRRQRVVLPPFGQPSRSVVYYVKDFYHAIQKLKVVSYNIRDKFMNIQSNHYRVEHRFSILACAIIHPAHAGTL